MTTRIATIAGTALVPGVSKHGRLYTKEAIAKAVQRAQARLADPTARPITMLSHHGAGDDSTKIAGRVTKIIQAADGSAQFEADLAPTAAGRDIAALVTPERPFLNSVSIRGAWIGPVRSESGHETGDDLELDGIDWTKSPGIDGARITQAKLAEARRGRTMILESVEDARPAKPLREMSGEELTGELLARVRAAGLQETAASPVGAGAPIGGAADPRSGLNLTDEQVGGLSALVGRAFRTAGSKTAG